MENKLELRSSDLGYISTGVWSLLWLIVLGGLAFVLYVWAQNNLALMESSDRWSVVYFAAKDHYHLYNFALIVTGVIMGVIVGCNFLTAFYCLREVNTFVMGKDGHWEKLVCMSYGFPASVSISEDVIDRILEVKVRQSMIDRWYNVGSLTGKAIAYVNTEAKEVPFCIDGILNPVAARDAIMAGAGEHHGLDVRTAVKN